MRIEGEVGGVCGREKALLLVAAKRVRKAEGSALADASVVFLPVRKMPDAVKQGGFF